MAASQTKTKTASKAKLGTEPILSRDGKTVTYGLYPQKRVGDPKLIAALEGIATREPNGYYLHDGVYYAKLAARPSKPDYVFDDGTPIVGDNVYWFECEPIRWRVIWTRGDVRYLLSDVVLDASRYGDDSNEYAHSDIHGWLNYVFLKSAFTLGGKAIVATYVDNGAFVTDSLDNEFVSEDTEDKVYLLSYKDYLDPDFGFPSSTDKSRERCAKTTDWARARGAYSDTSPEYLNNGHYWTRSPYSRFYLSAWYVNHDGRIFVGHIYQGDFGVRPIIKVEIK